MNNLNYKVKVVDNFFDQDDFKSLCKLDLDINLEKNSNNKEFLTYHNEINDNVIKNSVINVELLKRLHTNYHKKLMEILMELNPEKAKLYDYSDFIIIVTSKNSKSPIHDDTPNKLLSGVIYLYPNENTGTKFYNNKKGEGETKIAWKQNRAVFFSRKERETWHSYEGDGKNSRIALVYNLMTNRIKEVYKIEKKSFFIGLLRFKINPYLYNYFKITI